MTHQDCILIVDDDPTTIHTLSSALRHLGQIRVASSGADALHVARMHKPDIVLLDIEMPGQNGFETCKAFKATANLTDIPIIFITSHDDAEQEVHGLALGAVDFISKPPRHAVVLARVSTHLRLKHLTDSLREASYSDPLTGAANRRMFDEHLDREWLRARRNGSTLSLLLLDIDHFKAYNDRHGHLGGDECLRQVAQSLKQCVRRPADLFARVGGEEFAILLPETAADGACCVAQNLLQDLTTRNIPHEASPTANHVTVSVGITATESMDAPTRSDALPIRGSLATSVDCRTFVETADLALYAAKRAGRSQARFLALDDRATPDRAVHVPPKSSTRLRTAQLVELSRKTRSAP